MKDSKIGLIGGGSWGSAIAKILLDAGCENLNWWVRSAEVRDSLQQTGRNPRHLSNVCYDAHRISASTCLADVVEHSHTIFLAIPSAYVADVLAALPVSAYGGKQFASLIKGVLPCRQQSVSMYLAQELGVSPNNIAIVSGPSHAEEVEAGMHTFLTVASLNQQLAAEIEYSLRCHYIHTTHTTDIQGVECCGLAKNIYAIAAGMCQGLGYGDNMNAVLTAGAFREMRAIVERYRGDVERDLCMPCYLGDLMVTCWSKHSRNRALGEAVALGRSVQQAFADMGSVAEGYYSVYSLHKLVQDMDIEVPIAEAVYNVLYEQAAPATEITRLITDVL